MWSDHLLININLSLQKQSASAKDSSYRRYKSIDKDALLADLRFSSFGIGSPDDVDHLLDLYNRILRDIVNEHAANISNSNKDIAHRFNTYLCHNI